MFILFHIINSLLLFIKYLNNIHNIGLYLLDNVEKMCNYVLSSTAATASQMYSKPGNNQ
jgi:hypothetical protein